MAGGSSSGAGPYCAAKGIIRIPDRAPNQTTLELPLIRVVKTTTRWKSRKAGERALRYIFFCTPPHAPQRINDCQFALGFERALAVMAVCSPSCLHGFGR